MIIDFSHGMRPSARRVRIEAVSLQNQTYYYRWLLEDGTWETKLSDGMGKFDILERISVKVHDCPSHI
ncbi:MAG: hypothetical protein ACO3A4_14315 [Silvanigrellaceae bacterium]